MKNELKIEFQRACRSTGMKISIFVSFAIAILHFILMVLPLRNYIYSGDYPLSVFGKWMCGEDGSVFPTLYYLIVPILIALPNAGSYKEDIKTGYIKNVITRTYRYKYLGAKYVVTFLIGGTVAVVPMILNFLLTALILPAVMPQASTGYFSIFSNSMLGDMFYAHPYVYLLIYMTINFIFFAALATLSLLAAHICDNLFTTILAPFIIYLLIYAITQLTGLHQLCPFGFLRPSQPIATNIFIVLGEIVAMCIAGGTYYYVGKKAEIY